MREILLRTPWENQLKKFCSNFVQICWSSKKLHEKNTLNLRLHYMLSVGICVWLYKLKYYAARQGVFERQNCVCVCESTRFPLLAELVSPVRKWTHLPASRHRLLLFSLLLTPPIRPSNTHTERERENKLTHTLTYNLNHPHTSTHRMISLH